MFTRGEHGNIADLAQSVERRAFNLVVVGSIPTVGNYNLVNFYYFFFIKFKKIEMVINI